ncbi:2'-5' RNA ligase family protein [Streptomyces sp. NPDC058653]|uniref:2'-5' RNA ligase family protein n=1 Tax=Streptomyces sp. NPDC058653 TaxID=3346576 RepID=UPI003666A885
MVNHWERPGWKPDTRAFYWMLVPDSEPFAAQVLECQKALEHLRFDAVNRASLHLTLGRVGDAGTLSQAALRSLGAAARDAVPASFDLVAVPLTASTGAIRYSVAPWHPILELHTALGAAGERHGITQGRTAASLRPHIGIAYCNRPVPTDAVRASISPLRSLPPVLMRIHEVQLVELRRRDNSYTWTTIHRIPLQ